MENDIELKNNKEQRNNDEPKEKLDKINLPKRKYAIIHGYNGHHFSGNQK
jgi:hypothetical protein